MNAGLTRNGHPLRWADIPELSPDDFTEQIIRGTGRGMRLVSYFGLQNPELALVAVLADDSGGSLAVFRTVPGETLHSVTPRAPQAHAFEREIAEQFDLALEGHPWPKPIRFEKKRRLDASGKGMDFFRVEGDEIHEVAVGPVHAGVIEPGHFRFQCKGEEVLHLEIALGYQHRAIEASLLGGPHKATPFQMEAVAGDTTAGHAMAYAQVIEALGKTQASARAHAIRGLALELERLANHVGDLGALSGDVAFLPAASYFGRIRGDYLNMSAVICGNRFSRGLVRPGGAGFDLGPKEIDELKRRLEAALADSTETADLLFSAPSAMGRFETTGALAYADADALGLVGPAARACGLARDVRRDHPSGTFLFNHLPLMTSHSGDVYSRAMVRWRECQKSARFVADQLAAMPAGALRKPVGGMAADSLVISLVEGWRGEICHAAVTDGNGRFARYKITDPSFHNWQGLSLALRGQQISDFPLINKSFNLSYCGHDL